jgi:hypothetical protein
VSETTEDTMIDLDTTTDPDTMTDLREKHGITLPEMRHVRLLLEVDTRTGEVVEVVTKVGLGTELVKPTGKALEGDRIENGNPVFLTALAIPLTSMRECLYSSTDSPFVRH